MRTTVIFLVRFVAMPLYAWAFASLLGVSGLTGVLAWGFVDFFWATEALLDASQKMGLRAALKLKDPNAPPELVAQLRALGNLLGLARLPELRVMDSQPGREGAGLVVVRRRPPMIVISRRMVESLEPQILAATLAHELGHFRRGDQRVYRLARFLEWGVLPILLVLTAFFGGSVWAAVFWTVTRAGLVLLSLAMRRRRETPADDLAIRLGLGPGLLRLLEWRDSVRPKNRPEAPRLLSTHPPSAWRMARILAVVERGEAAQRTG